MMKKQSGIVLPKATSTHKVRCRESELSYRLYKMKLENGIKMSYMELLRKCIAGNQSGKNRATRSMSMASLKMASAYIMKERKD
jgi:hypothetical protein